jgi:hypothetical protein
LTGRVCGVVSKARQEITERQRRKEKAEKKPVDPTVGWPTKNDD